MPVPKNMIALLFSLTVALVCTVHGFRPSMLHRPTTQTSLRMSSDDLALSAQPVIEEWIDLCEPGLKKATLAMFRACKEIAYKVRTASCDKMACFNEFGDEQLAIDILANNVIFNNLRQCGAVATASSEETPVEGTYLSSVSPSY